MRYFCPDPENPDGWMELGDFPDYREAESAYYKHHNTFDPLLVTEQDVAKLADLLNKEV